MKEEIIKAAEEEVRLKSLSFTIDDLAARLGVSKKTIYQHISSKEEIVSTILLEMKADMERQQIELFGNSELGLREKMKTLMKISPTKDELITPTILNQLKTSFPRVYKQIDEIYHYNWIRFNALYEQGVEEGAFQPFDTVFFKELYISAVTNLPQVAAMSRLGYQEIVSKTVDQLFDGIR